MQTLEITESPRAAALHLNVCVMVPATDTKTSGVLAEFVTGEATIIVEHEINSGSRVSLEIRGFPIDGVVLRCVREHERYRLRISLNDGDEFDARKIPRFPVSIPARIFVPGVANPTTVRIVDISGVGLGLELSIHVEPGSMVAVESASNLALGVIRFSQELAPGRCRVGVQLCHIVREPKRNGVGIFGRTIPSAG